MLKYDFESNPDNKKWCSLLYGLLCTLGFNDARYISLYQIGMKDWKNQVELYFTNIFHPSVLNLI